MARLDGDLAIFGNGSLVLPDSSAVCDAGEKERGTSVSKAAIAIDAIGIQQGQGVHPCHSAS